MSSESHEIGHVLLGPRDSTTGIMLGKRGHDALARAFTGHLVFTSQDVSRMRSILMNSLAILR
jgi:hypothetical protein